MQLSIDTINNRINTEISYEIIDQLKDENLIDEYKNCSSVKSNIELLRNILIKNNIDNNKIVSIINDYLLHLIPPGTKGVMRGNKFNNIIKNIINDIVIDRNRYNICFEKMCNLYPTNEIPDWYILDKNTNRAIIGYNQLDIWNGGQQINRGYKYLIDNKLNTDKSKLLCVICNEIKLVNNKNKTYKLFDVGFQNDTLCYPNNISNIIQKYFILND